MFVYADISVQALQHNCLLIHILSWLFCRETAASNQRTMKLHPNLGTGPSTTRYIDQSTFLPVFKCFCCASLSVAPLQWHWRWCQLYFVAPELHGWEFVSPWTLCKLQTWLMQTHFTPLWSVSSGPAFFWCQWDRLSGLFAGKPGKLEWEVSSQCV